jgi:outer membrane protein TolC
MRAKLVSRWAARLGGFPKARGLHRKSRLAAVFFALPRLSLNLSNSSDTCSLRMRGIAVSAVLLLASCSSYEPLELDPDSLMLELRAAEAPEVGPSGLDEDAAVAFALANHPALRVQRAEIGVAEAGLLAAQVVAPPEFGWSAVDFLIGGSADDLLSGFDLLFPSRTKEKREALRTLAEAGLSVAEVRLAAAEWDQVQRVRRAFRGAQAEQRRAELHQLELELANEFQTASQTSRRSGAATELEVQLSQLSLAAAQADLRRSAAAVRAAQRELVQSLGLPPEIEIQLTHAVGAQDDFLHESLPEDLDALVDLAATRRPDVLLEISAWNEAEAGVRIAHALLEPEFAIGLGFRLLVPSWRRHAQSLIDMAEAERDAATARVRARMHQVRAEVADALATWQSSKLEAASQELNLAPVLERARALIQESLRSGTATPSNLLLARRQLLEAERGLVEARIRFAEARLALELILGPGPSPFTLLHTNTSL